MSRAFSVRRLVVSLLLFPVCQLVWAEEQPLTYDRISLSANAGTQVENDTLVAVLYAQREGRDPAKLADEVNQQVRWAVERVKQAAGITLRTLDYHTSPVHRDGKLSGWRVRQSIRLESTDSARLSTLIGALQEKLAVQSVSHSISPASRRQAENRLIAEAIGAFNARASLVTKALDRDEYRLVRMEVNTSDRPIYPRPMRARTMSMEAAAAPPVLEPGTQEVRVTVVGTIELQL